MNIDELITKYLTNESTADENAALLDWVISNESNKKDFIQTCQIWHNTNLSHSKFDTTKAYNKFLDAKNKTLAAQPKTFTLWKAVSAVAAIAILTIGMFFLFQKQTIELNTIANNNVTTKTVALPDGSEIFLNDGASVTFPKEFEKSERNISISGTVFCKVFRNENAPFIVKTSTLNVEVLGTSFEVSSKIGENHVIVESGKVKVSEANSHNSFIITKGKRIDLNALGFNKSTNADINFSSWKTGLLCFNNTSLKEVFLDLGRHYNCTFIITDESIYNENITGTYQDFSLSNIITIINSAFPKLTFTAINSKTIQVSL